MPVKYGSSKTNRMWAKGNKGDQKKQLLTANMEKVYENWIATDWKKVFFSDESHFLVQGKRSQHVHRSIGESFVNAARTTLKEIDRSWGSVSNYVIGLLLSIERKMNAEKYGEVAGKKKWSLI